MLIRQECARKKKWQKSAGNSGKYWVVEGTNRPEGATRSLEERFTTLKRLKDKGLITDEEYAQKRKPLLLVVMMRFNPVSHG